MRCGARGEENVEEEAPRDKGKGKANVEPSCYYATKAQFDNPETSGMAGYGYE